MNEPEHRILAWVEFAPRSQRLLDALPEMAAHAGLTVDGLFRPGDTVGLAGASPEWSVRVPLRAGRLDGTFSEAALQVAGALAFLAQVFDLGLVEWGLVGAPADIEAVAAAGPPPSLEAPVRLPAIGRVTYLSPDLAYPPDLAGSVGIASVRRVRTPSGGALIGAPDLVQRKEIAARTPGFLQTWDRPPIDAYDLPDEELLLRDVSPGLAGCLRQGAEWIAKQFSLPRPTSLEALEAADVRLGPRIAQLEKELEPWSMYAGEVAVALGGKWRRLLDPEVSFPENMLVELPGGVSFHPYLDLREAAEDREPPDLAGLLGEMMSSAEPE